MNFSGSSSFFLGANTPVGFYSLFNELYSPEDGWTLYIIKGGPGTGKSTLMKKVASVCDSKGLYCERIYCSSDPNSLDAVIIPSLKVSIADGTSPHILEPKYPGVSEKLIDLGMFRDDKKLRENRDIIIEKIKENSFQHKKCVDFLAAARSAENDNASVVIPSMKMDTLHKFSEKLSDAKFPVTSDSRGIMKKRFLSALTPSGIVLFRDTFTSLCENIVVLKDSFGCASSVMLKVLSLKAAEKGLSGIICYCPMSPEYRPEHLILPELKLGFYTSNPRHPDDFGGAFAVDCMRFYDNAFLQHHKNRIAFNNRSRDEMLSGAAEYLKNAKRIHDEIERYYIEAMDFNRMGEYGEAVIEEIFNL